MKKYPYNQARQIIQSICKAASNGEYDTREKFHSMLEANPDIAVQGYNAHGKIFFWNMNSTRLYGYKEEEAVKADIFELILPPDMRSLAGDMILSARKTGKTPQPAACDLLHRSGDSVTVFSGHLMFNWDGPSTPEFYCIDIGIEPSEK